MLNPNPSQERTLAYQLRFASLRNTGHGYAFPCDRQGAVALDALSERARDNYFFARAAVGLEFTFPQVVEVEAG